MRDLGERQVRKASAADKHERPVQETRLEASARDECKKMSARDRGSRQARAARAGDRLGGGECGRRVLGMGARDECEIRVRKTSAGGECGGRVYLGR